MIFLRNALKSIYDPEFYRELLKVPVGRSFHYYFSMILVLSVVATVAFDLWQIPKLARGDVSSWVDNLSQSAVGWSQVDLERLTNEIKTVAQEAPVVLAFAFFISLFSLGVLYLVYLLLVALLVWGIASSRQVDANFSKAYQLSLHAATLALIVKFAAFVIAPGANLYFLPTIILLLVVSLNLKPHGRLALEP